MKRKHLIIGIIVLLIAIPAGLYIIIPNVFGAIDEFDINDYDREICDTLKEIWVTEFQDYVATSKYEVKYSNQGYTYCFSKESVKESVKRNSKGCYFPAIYYHQAHFIYICTYSGDILVLHTRTSNFFHYYNHVRMRFPHAETFIREFSENEDEEYEV